MHGGTGGRLPGRVTSRIDDDQAFDDDGLRRLSRALGVYPAQRDTALLGAVIEKEVRPGDRVLDVCTGSGALAVRAARCAGTEVTALDVSRTATLVASWRARTAGVPLSTGCGDLFAPVTGRRFDLVVANPPYVPARAVTVPRRGRRRAWDAGTDGRLLVDRICREARRVLAPHGRMLLVQSEFTGIDRSREMLLEEGYDDVEVVARHEHPFGPVLSRRAVHLERAGLLTPGRRHEELAVLRATA